jgi:hypothetical protein
MRSRQQLSNFLKIHREQEAGLKVCPKCFFDNCEQIYYHYFCRLSQKRRNEKRDSFFTANVFLPAVAVAAAAATVGKDDKGGCGRAVGKDVRGGGDLFFYGVVVKKNCFCVFSILMLGKEAVCPDGLFVPAIFQESDFYFNSLKMYDSSAF